MTTQAIQYYFESGHGLDKWLKQGMLRLQAWAERARQRRQLAGLDERLLQDIGVSRAQAMAEAEKPFWL
jgi:uncharacterized protein YjiS (DUF1127 family)